MRLAGARLQCAQRVQFGVVGGASVSTVAATASGQPVAARAWSIVAPGTAR